MIIICSRTIPEISHRIFAPHNHQDLQGEQNCDPLSASTDNRKGHQSRRNILPSSRSRNVCSLNDFCSSLSPQSIRIPSRTHRVVWEACPGTSTRHLVWANLRVASAWPTATLRAHSTSYLPRSSWRGTSSIDLGRFSGCATFVRFENQSSYTWLRNKTLAAPTSCSAGCRFIFATQALNVLLYIFIIY